MGSQPGISIGHRRAQAAAFDNIGEQYDQAFPHKEGQITAGEWLIGQLARGARVLDAGCGTGLPTARQLLDAGLAVTGIDISAVMLELARRNVPEADLRRLDLTEVGSELGHFDAAVAFFSLLMLWCPTWPTVPPYSSASTCCTTRRYPHPPGSLEACGWSPRQGKAAGQAGRPHRTAGWRWRREAL
ncbi:MAG TPA: methyltransferase domain-containing protein [Streptosporangiaceae bacterium]